MSLYFKYFKVHLKSELQYKISFILSFISQFFVFFGYYFTVLCLFDNFSNIKGFTLYEVLLTFGIIQTGFSFCETFFRGIDRFETLIINGELDRLLLRPRGILLQVLCNEIDFVKIIRMLQSLIILIIALIKLDIVWNISKVITLILMMLSSIVATSVLPEIHLIIVLYFVSSCQNSSPSVTVRPVFEAI